MNRNMENIIIGLQNYGRNYRKGYPIKTIALETEARKIKPYKVETIKGIMRL